MRYEYTTVGHVTIDVLDDGTRRAGGTAFYSALQAARLGLRTLIVTRGVPAELERLLEPFAHELDLRVLQAPATTTLRTSGRGSERRQFLLAWAGAFAELAGLESTIVHLAPVARELPSRWRGSAELVGLTPQGLVRGWEDRPGAQIVQVPAARSALELARGCDAIVLSEDERSSCAGLIAAASAAGAFVAITAGARPVRLIAQGEELELDVFAHERPVEDLGAGDVFAAALFVGLHEGRDRRDAARFAGAAAALRVARAGPAAVAERAQVEKRLLSLPT